MSALQSAGVQLAGVPLAGESDKSGPIGLAVILVLCLVSYLLFKSMSRHMRKVREEFPDGKSPARTSEPTIEPTSEPTIEPTAEPTAEPPAEPTRPQSASAETTAPTITAQPTGNDEPPVSEQPR